MAIVPRNPADQIRFYASHVPVWSEHPSELGLSDEIVADLDAKLAAAEAAYRAALELRTQAEAATLLYRDAVRKLHTRGAAAIATIKAFAGVHADPFIYSKAQIDPPSTSRAAPPTPGAPSVASATVDPDGALTLAWNAAHGDSVGPSSGIFFEVFRQRSGLGETRPALVGTTAGLSLRDPDIGPGVNIYTVRARRGTRTGDSSMAVAITLPGGIAPGNAERAADAHAAPTGKPHTLTPRTTRRAA